MKKSVFTLLLALCFGALFGQSNPLQHVIVMMSERYNDSQLSQKTALMTKEQRRDFVIAERKAFCQASQAQVLDFLEGYKSADMVSDLKTFWSFNGFSCSVSDEVIAQLAQRKDVAVIIPDEMRQMIPSNEKARPVSTRDNAWHVDKINAPAVWNYDDTGYTGNGVIIGLIDTGVNYNHIDIANSMWDGGSEFPTTAMTFSIKTLTPWTIKVTAPIPLASLRDKVRQAPRRASPLAPRLWPSRF